MRKKAVGLFGAALLWAACMGVAVAQQQPPPQDSVAEAARKAKAEKAKAKSRKVYSEEDLAGLKQKNISVVGQEPAPAPPPASAPADEKKLDAHAKAAAEPKPEVRDEAYWRGRARKLLDQIADVDVQIAKVKDEIKQGGTAAFDTQSGVSQDVIYYWDRNLQLQKLEERRKDLQKQMDDLRAEGLKAGAPPGWFR